MKNDLGRKEWKTKQNKETKALKAEEEMPLGGTTGNSNGLSQGRGQLPARTRRGSGESVSPGLIAQDRSRAVHHLDHIGPKAALTMPTKPYVWPPG